MASSCYIGQHISRKLRMNHHLLLEELYIGKTFKPDFLDLNPNSFHLPAVWLCTHHSISLSLFAHLYNEGNNSNLYCVVTRIPWVNISKRWMQEAGGERDDRWWDGWMASLTRWTWVWASSGRWWRLGKPDVLQSIGLQRARHGWATEQQQLIEC